MGSLGSPEIWVPYLTNKDCSLGFCSLYCPQWCYIIDPPPPPPLNFSDGDHNPSSISFSSLIVAIIGILVSAFLLVTYYIIIFKHCGNNNGQRRSGGENPNNGYESDNDENRNPRLNSGSTLTGLDEALIKAIQVCKYKKGDGFVEGADCSVCLSEFREDESLRLLPQCSHAFHIQCIDTWLRSHSNCPLCRTNVVSVVRAIERPINGESTDSGDQGCVSQNSDSRVEELIENNTINGGYSSAVMSPKSRSTSRTSLSSFSDLGNLEERQSIVIEVRDEIRRSISMDFHHWDQILVANEREEEINVIDERQSCSKLNGSDGKGYAMKRSVSSGRFFLSRSLGVGRGKTNAFAV